MANNDSKGNEKISGLLAILPSLIQVLAVFTAGFASQLGLNDYFFEPKLVTISNLFALLLSLSLIGCISYIQSLGTLITINVGRKIKIIKFIANYFLEPSDTDPKQEAALLSINAPKQKKSRNIVFYACLQFASFAVLLYTIALKINNATPTTSLIMCQYLAYISFLTLSSGLLFIWIKSYIESTLRFRADDFIPNFENALVKHGYLKRDVKITSNQPESMVRQIGCTIDNKNFIFVVSYDGNEIVKATAIN